MKNNNENSSSSPQTQVDVQPNVGVVEIPPDTLNRPELQGAEIVDESDVGEENANCITFLPKDNYFRIRPETTLKSTTQIICAGHYSASNLSVKYCYPLYFPMNHHLHMPNVFLTHDKDLLTWY